jgi:hypothetical protein
MFEGHDELIVLARASPAMLRNKNAPLSQGAVLSCGKGGIRTLDTVARITVFETVPFNLSGTFPDVYKFNDYLLLTNMILTIPLPLYHQ